MLQNILFSIKDKKHISVWTNVWVVAHGFILEHLSLTREIALTTLLYWPIIALVEVLLRLMLYALVAEWATLFVAELWVVCLVSLKEQGTLHNGLAHHGTSSARVMALTTITMTSTVVHWWQTGLLEVLAICLKRKMVRKYLSTLLWQYTVMLEWKLMIVL